jgi:hypothetical protein
MKLHEAIALRKGEVGRNKARLTEVYKALQKAVVYGGFVKSYEPCEQDGEQLPSETKRVQRTVAKDLGAVQTSLLTLWDTVASVEYGNCTAKGDIEIDGQTVMKDVPVTTLLFLETQLNDLRTTLEAIPTLSPDYAWSLDENDGLFKTDVVKTHRNVKHTRPIVLYDATPEHPAQTQLIEEPKLAGYWNAVQHSGACPAVRKVVLTSRVEKMLDAVKSARARANGSLAPVINMAPILNYIFE